jgi:hypothetical protein
MEQMQLPADSFNALLSSIENIYIFFTTNFEKRGVREFTNTTTSVLEGHWLMRRDYMYDFNFSGGPRKSDGAYCKIKICFYPNEKVFIRFDWQKPNEKMNTLSAPSFLQEKLSSEALLDVLSKFLRGEVDTDRKSRSQFLRELKETTK